MLRSGQQQNRFRRDAWLEVNLSNLEFNIKALYEEFQKPLIPVLKADAYGHGATVIAELLDSYDFIYAYAIASIDEALALRAVSKRKLIVLGVTPDWALETALLNDIDITVADLDTAIKLDKLASKNQRKAKIHLKIDTGMNRIGFKFHEETKEALRKIVALENVEIETAFTHMADAKDANFSSLQVEEFYNLLEAFNFKLHPAASIAARNLKNKDFDFVRIGIELYGLENPQLKPLLSLYSRISFIKGIKAKESVSYSRTWIAEGDTRLATLPLGYADGLHRMMSNKIHAFYKGQKLSQVGMITMDQIMLDLGKDSDARVGDTVELLGENISIQEWANAAQTISYEIATSLNLRLPKSYTRK